MHAPPFDPLNPPSARNPLPAYGTEPSMKLLLDLMRMPHHARPQHLPPEAVDRLAEIEAALSASLMPATVAEIREAVVALLSHYPSRRMSVVERASVARDWIVDLAAVPADIIAAACQEWRRGANVYAPNPGQLLALARPVLEARRLHHQFASARLSAQRAAASEDQRKAGAA